MIIQLLYYTLFCGGTGVDLDGSSTEYLQLIATKKNENQYGGFLERTLIKNEYLLFKLANSQLFAMYKKITKSV